MGPSEIGNNWSCPAAIPCASSVVQVTCETASVRVSSPTVTGGFSLVVTSFVVQPGTGT